MEKKVDYLIDIFKSNHMKRRKKKDKKLFLNFAKKYFSDYGYKMIEDSNEKNINVYSDNIQNAKYIFTAHYDTSSTSIISNISKIFLPLIGSWSINTTIITIGLIVIIAFEINLFIGLLALLLFILILLEGGFKRDNKYNMNDNTSGLISLFLLASTSYNNKDSAFILFDNEEKGLKGSKQFAKKSINLINKDAVIINLDCVGDGTTWCIYSSENTIKSNLIKNLNGAEIGKGTLTSSDHKPFIGLRDTIYI